MPILGTVASSFDNTPEVRGVFMDGSTLQYVNINNTGNSTFFGNLTRNTGQNAGLSSSTRGLFAGGYASGSITNTIDYITVLTAGNAIDFGDLTVARDTPAGCNSSTRGLIGGGWNGSSRSNVIDYVTIASTGNAIDFGDLTSGRVLRANGCSSPTRGVFVGGDNLSGTRRTIDYVTIATTGNATSFGQLGTDTWGLPGRSGVSCASSNTRGILMGGFGDSIGIVSTTDYITIASGGDSVFFGNLTQGRSQGASTASPTRATMAGGRTGSSVNTIDYFIIATTGNATDFGDLTVARYVSGGTSDSHGGL